MPIKLQSKSKQQKPRKSQLEADERKPDAARIVRQPSLPNSAYLTALTQPFSDKAIGARVPDMYSAPTVTAHIRKIYTIRSDSNGDAIGMVLPSMLAHCYMSAGSFTSAGGVVTWTPWTGVGGVLNAFAVTSEVDTKSKIANGRIVSYGVRFKNTLSMTDIKGNFSAARIPLKDDMIIPSAANVGGSFNYDAAFTREAWFQAAGCPYTGVGDNAFVNPVAITSLPENITLSSVELAEKGLDIVPKVITPYAFGLKNVADSVAGNDVSPGVATGAIYAGDDDYIKFGGFESIIFASRGLPPSSACMTMEIVYHIEGTPSIAAANNGGLIQDTPMKSKLDINGFHRALEVAATAASFTFPGLASTVGKLLGPMRQ